MCENINDLNLQIEKSQIWSIDEECTSNLSADLTNAKILNYLKSREIRFREKCINTIFSSIISNRQWRKFGVHAALLG